MTTMTSLMIDESQLIGASVDEDALLEKMYPEIGDQKLISWKKRRFVCEHGIEWNQYVAEIQNGDGHVIIEIPRAGHR